MDLLVACKVCNRHAKLREPCCPFCGGALPRRAPRPRVVRKLTRAAIFFGGAVLSACSSPAEPTPAPGPPMVVDMTPMQPVVTESPEPEALPPIEPVAVVTESPEDARAERAHAERRKHRARTTQVQHHQVHDVAMPYGAPPADFDVV